MVQRYKKFIFVSLLISVISFGYLFIVSPANAGTEVELQDQLYKAGNKAWGGVPGPTGLAQIIQLAISAFLGLLGIIFLVLIIYSGFHWMTAGGDEEKVTLAKSTLIRAVIGLAIIIGAYAITYFVFSNLPGGPGSGNLGFGS